MTEKLKIILVRSLIGVVPKQKATVKALGLTKMHETVKMPDNGAVRDMVVAVQHLAKVEEV